MINSKRLKLSYLYNEGNWRYNRVLVDDEQVGFVAVNPMTAKVGITAHHPDSYPNAEVFEAILQKLSKSRKREYSLQE